MRTERRLVFVPVEAGIEEEVAPVIPLATRLANDFAAHYPTETAEEAA